MRLIDLDAIMAQFPDADFDGDVIENTKAYPYWSIGIDGLINVLKAVPIIEQRWIPVSERLPNNHECIKNNGLFNVSDGNRSYFEWFDIYDTKRFVKPTIAGFRVDNAVTAWMPLPQPYAESEDKE